MIKFKDFEDFLQNKHVEQNPMLLDDDLPDHYAEWSCLSYEEMCEYADEYAKIACKQFLQNASLEDLWFQKYFKN